MFGSLFHPTEVHSHSSSILLRSSTLLESRLLFHSVGRDSAVWNLTYQDCNYIKTLVYGYFHDVLLVDLPPIQKPQILSHFEREL